MICENVQLTVIELGFDPAARQRVAAALAHLETCVSCRDAVGGYDRVAAILATPAAAIDEGAPPSGWQAFETGLMATARRPPGGRRRWSRLSLAAAAALVIGLMGLAAGFGAGLRWNSHGAAPIGSMAALTPAEVSQRTREFTEINRAFDGRAGWVMLSGRQSDLGLAGTASTLDPRPLVLRLTLSRDGRAVANADVLILPGQTADLAIPTLAGSQLRCRVATSASDPSALSLRAELRAAAEQEAQALLTTRLGMQGATAASAGQLVTPDGEYDLKVLFALPARPVGRL